VRDNLINNLDTLVANDKFISSIIIIASTLQLSCIYFTINLYIARIPFISGLYPLITGIAKMAQVSSALLSLLAFAFSVSAQRCPIQFDGRVSSNSLLAVFDTAASPFSPSSVFGNGIAIRNLILWLELRVTLQIAGLAWSQILQFPAVPASLVSFKPKSRYFGGFRH
jgi:hypothetical protein